MGRDFFVVVVFFPANDDLRTGAGAKRDPALIKHG